jgi:ABC-type arginine transport system ATPase subunit
MESPERSRSNETARSLDTSEQAAESRKLRRLQWMIGMVLSTIYQSPNLTVEQASELVANARHAALSMFPGKELAFDLLYKPRLQRAMRDRFRTQ